MRLVLMFSARLLIQLENQKTTVNSNELRYQSQFSSKEINSNFRVILNLIMKSAPSKKLEAHPVDQCPCQITFQKY